MTTKKKINPKEDALAIACGIFLCDESDVDDNGKDIEISPVEQYKKLKQAEKDGNGDDNAGEYACVWQPLEHHSVDDLIAQVDGLQKSFLEFLKTHSKK